MGATAGATAATGWEGVGGAAMMATAMPYVAALEALAGWVQQSAASAAAIEQAYDHRKAAMIQVPICTTNRDQPGRARRDQRHRPEHSGRSSRSTSSTSATSGPTTRRTMGCYEAIVTAILAALGIPPPPRR